MNVQQWIYNSEIGPLYLVASPQGLRGVHWSRQAVPVAPSLKSKAPEIVWIVRTIRELEEYFAGQRQNFEVPLDVRGTPFQELVWGALRRIPYGKTCSYSEIAAQIRRPKAIRAVGTANGRNPVSIILPCHRVIAANGTLGGYAGGLRIKTHLLGLEKRVPMATGTEN